LVPAVTLSIVGPATSVPRFYCAPSSLVLLPNAPELHQARGGPRLQKPAAVLPPFSLLLLPPLLSSCSRFKWTIAVAGERKGKKEKKTEKKKGTRA
jgi:hypothetical protein